MTILEMLKILARGLSWSVETGLIFTIKVDAQDMEGNPFDLPVKPVV